MAFTVLDNTPSAGCIQWSAVHMVYNGVTYAVADGYTNYTYVYWTLANPNNFIVSNTFPNLGPDDAVVFLNKSGTHLTVPGATILDGDLIVPGSIFASAIAANTITGAQIAADSITGTQIAAGAISASELAVGAVTANSIAANAVGASAIAADAVTATNIVAGSITGDKIAANTITANNMVAGTITAASGVIANAAVGSAQISSLTADKIQGGTLVLGGAGNVNGLLNIKNASGATIVTGDVTGLTVDGGSYFTKDYGLVSSILPSANLAFDPSFSQITYNQAINNSPYTDVEVTTPQTIGCGWNAWSGTTQMAPKIYDATCVPNGVVTALFGNSMAIVNSANYFNSGLISVVPGVTYFLSAHHIQLIGTGFRSTTSSKLRLVAQFYIDGSTYGTPVTIDATSTTSWQRSGGSFTVPAGSGVNGVMLSVKAQDTNWIYVDGVQLVIGSQATKYYDNTELYTHANDMSAHPYLDSLNLSYDLTVYGSATVAGALSGSSLNIAGNSSSATGFEIGKSSNADTPYIDLHSSGTSNDYDVRLIASGGNSSAGNGTLTMTAALVSTGAAVELTRGGSDGYAVRNLNTSGQAPAIWYTTVYCSGGATVTIDHPDVAGAYQAVATSKDNAVACRATAGATTSTTYLYGTASGNINFALLAFV